MEKIIVTVGAQVRGTNQQEALGFTANEGSLTWTWGMQPAEALISWVKESGLPETILPLAAVTLEFGGHTFHGICEEAVTVNSHDDRSLTQRFRDSRVLLQFDLIYAQFNLRDHRLVNGQFVRRFRHLLPVNYNANAYTFTNAPLTVWQILGYCFSAQTVESPWSWSAYDGATLAAMEQPIYDLDAGSGKKLGSLLQEIAERAGLEFTLMGGRYSLVWAIKGMGDIPTAPENSTARREGVSLSENPTRLRILGDRNLYQVLDIPLEKDWQPAWEAFLDLDMLADDLFQNEKTQASEYSGVPAGTPYKSIPNDAGELVGRQLAAARARTLLVEEYAALRDVRSGSGEAFRDYRRAFNQSRLQLPAAVYIQHLLFRAFRLPTGFGFTNFQGCWSPLMGLELQDQGLCTITSDPVTGAMTAWPEDFSMSGNGYAVAQSLQIGFDAFRTCHPDSFKVTDWIARQDLWQALPFKTDDSGEDGKFIVFDEPVIRTSALYPLIGTVEISGVPQKYPALKANAQVTVPPVRAALTFAGERFSLVYGVGTRDEVENVGGLNGQFILAPGGGVVELRYADGETASEKADDLADRLLLRQFYLTAGGYSVQGSNATQLSPMIDRVTVQLSAAGLEERVDYANPRSRNLGPRGTVQVELPPEYARRAQMQTWAPSQRENLEQARQMRLLAAAFRSDKRVTRLFYDAVQLMMGSEPGRGVPVQGTIPAEATLGAGTPLFCDATDLTPDYKQKPPWYPVNGDPYPLLQPVFKGVTVVDGQPASGLLKITRTGDENVVLARVKGPVAFNDAVGIPGFTEPPELIGYAKAVDYLTTSPHTPVGNVLDAWTGTDIKYVKVKLTGAGCSEVDVVVCLESGASKTYRICGREVTT